MTQQKNEPAWKQDGGKPRMDLIAPEFLFGTANVLTYGAKKYSFEVENIGDLPLEKVKIYDSTFDFDLTSLFLKTTLGVGEKEKVTKSFLILEEAEDPFLNSVTATY